MSAACRYSLTAPRKPAEPTAAAAVLALLDAQTCLTEGIEQLIRFESIEWDYVDGRLGDAMRRIAAARSVAQDLKRKALGLTTIAETG